MIIHILTLFPEVFEPIFNSSIIKRAQDKKIVQIKVYNLRDWALDKHGTVDDRPYGGGPGMILKVEPIYQAIKDIKGKDKKLKVFLLSPRGKTFNQALAQELSELKEILLICGHYEGFDERIRNFIDGEISVGDYVLTGGEIPAMAITDAIIRLIPGVLKKLEATKAESFSTHLGRLVQKTPSKRQNSRQQSSKALYLEYPQYTRPEKFKGLAVPKILLSGNHQKISCWQKENIKKRKTLKKN
jgi:tRNA (guanine37-N1)-methyltransferase